LPPMQSKAMNWDVSGWIRGILHTAPGKATAGIADVREMALKVDNGL